MSDLPVRDGPPVSPGIAGDQPSNAEPVIPDVVAGPVNDAVITYRPAPVRSGPTRPLTIDNSASELPDPAGPTSHGRTGALGPALTRMHAAPARAVTVGLSLDPARLGAIALVIALAIGAVWLDRDRHDPVAGFGIIPESGASEALAPQSVLAVGNHAPNFRLRATNGEIVELTDLGGSAVLIHFWTTWCLICTGEFATLQHVADTHRGNLHVAGINAGESAGRAGEAADANGASYPMLLDRDLEVSTSYGVQDYPATIVIDATGIIASIDLGPISAAALETRLDAALGN